MNFHSFKIKNQLNEYTIIIVLVVLFKLSKYGRVVFYMLEALLYQMSQCLFNVILIY